MPAGLGETKIEAPVSKYWNSKKTPAAKGDQVRGVVLRAEAGEYKGKPTTQYVLQGDDGNEIYLPNHAVLNKTMLKVPVNSMVRVVYMGKGEATRGRSAPELYEVYLQTDYKPEPKNEIKDPSGALLVDLKKAAGWEDGAFWDMVGNHVKTLSEGTKLVDKLKKEGKIVNDNGMWKATV